MHLSNTKIMLQSLRWRCAQCTIHHERNVREEQHHIYLARTSNNRMISSGELYCCLLPQRAFSDRNNSNKIYFWTNKIVSFQTLNKLYENVAVFYVPEKLVKSKTPRPVKNIAAFTYIYIM